MPVELAATLEMTLTPPSMFQVAFTTKLVVVSRMMELPVVSVVLVPKVKNELVAPPLKLLVTNRLVTASVPLLSASAPEPVPAATVRMPMLATEPPVMVSVLLLETPVPMVTFCAPPFQTTLLKMVRTLLDELLPIMLAAFNANVWLLMTTVLLPQPAVPPMFSAPTLPR